MESTRSGRVRADSARGLHVAANVSELFRSLEESSLAELPFLVGCGRITQTIDFLARQFRRFRSFVGSGPSPLSTREPQLYKPTDGFGPCSRNAFFSRSASPPSFGTITVSVIDSVGSLNSTMTLTSTLSLPYVGTPVRILNGTGASLPAQAKGRAIYEEREGV